MSEKVIWKSTPSHYECLGGHILGGILILPTLGLSLFYNLYLYFKVRTTTYILTDRSIIRKSGVFSRKTDELMLFRIQDTTLEEPFLMRFVGLSNIKIYSTDRSDSIFYITAVNNGDKLRMKIRNLSENLKEKMRIRPLDTHPQSDNMENDIF